MRTEAFHLCPDFRGFLLLRHGSKQRHTGVGTSKVPVRVSFPVSGSTAWTATVSPFCPPASSHLPLGSMAKCPRSLHPGRDNLHQGEQAVLLYLMNGDCVARPGWRHRGIFHPWKGGYPRRYSPETRPFFSVERV